MHPDVADQVDREPLGAATEPGAERRSARPVRAQLRAALPIVPVWLVGIGALGFIATNTPTLVEDVMFSASQLSGARWYVGIVKSVCVLSWCVGASTSAWAWFICRIANRPGAARMFLGGAVLSAYLLADELLELHAELLPVITGLPKPVVELCIAASAALWVVVNHHELVRTRLSLFLLASAALAASIMVDISPDMGRPRLHLLVEDGAKLLGVLGWATYFSATTRDVLRSVVHPIRTDPSGG